jgi:hypothetical protein
MSRKHTILLAAAVMTVAMLVVVAEPAFAASPVSGKVGNEMKSWGSALLFSTATLVGLPALARQDLKSAGLIALTTVILGGYIYAPKTVEGVVTGIWNTVG